MLRAPTVNGSGRSDVAQSPLVHWAWRVSGLVIAACLLIVPPHGAYAQGRLIWELEQDFGVGGDDRIDTSALSGGTIVIAGTARYPDGTGSDGVVEVRRRDTGAHRWSFRFGPGDSPRVATLPDRVFVASRFGHPSTSYVRAFDVATGAIAWETVWTSITRTSIQAIFATPSVIVVMGNQSNQDGSTVAMVKAYDPDSGYLLWEDFVTRPGAEVRAWTVTANRSHVFVGAESHPTGAPSERSLLLLGYDARSGASIWERSLPTGTPLGLTVVSGRVVATGRQRDTGGGYLVAFRERTGAVLWQHAAGSGEDFKTFANLAADVERVVVFGTCFLVADSVVGGALVQSHDLRTGVVQWRRCEGIPWTQPGHPVVPFIDYSDVAVGGDTVYFAGLYVRPFLSSELLVRAFRAVDGALLWDDRSHRGNVTRPVSLALGRNRFFVATNDRDPGAPSDPLVRAYLVEGAPTVVSVGRDVVPAGGVVTVDWANVAEASALDWLGLYQDGAADSEWLDWVYVSCTKGPEISRTSGSCSFQLPGELPAADYELRLFADDGYTRLATSNPFTVFD
jgi:outer membrane protein assembly factor BamB